MEIFTNKYLQIIYISQFAILNISTTQNSLGSLEFRLWEDFVQNLKMHNNFAYHLQRVVNV